MENLKVTTNNTENSHHLNWSLLVNWLLILVLTAQECDWQDKLEKKLLRSTTVAADAEEISEELDVIDFFFFLIHFRS